MVDQAQQTLDRLGISEPVEQVLADTGYWQNTQIARLEQRGLRVLVPPYPWARRAPEAVAMQHELTTPDGQRDYRCRQQIIEPVFARTKHHRAITRVLRRGRARGPGRDRPDCHHPQPPQPPTPPSRPGDARSRAPRPPDRRPPNTGRPLHQIIDRRVWATASYGRFSTQLPQRAPDGPGVLTARWPAMTEPACSPPDGPPPRTRRAHSPVARQNCSSPSISRCAWPPCSRWRR